MKFKAVRALGSDATNFPHPLFSIFWPFNSALLTLDGIKNSNTLFGLLFLVITVSFLGVGMASLLNVSADLALAFLRFSCKKKKKKKRKEDIKSLAKQDTEDGSVYWKPHKFPVQFLQS